MKTSKYIVAALGLLVMASSLLSCTRNDDYYNAPPNNNNNAHNNEPPTGFFDDFSSDKYSWAFGSPADSAYATVQNGNLLIVNYAHNGMQTAVINTGLDFSRDFTVSASIKSNNKMGIVFGASNSDYGYSFILDSTGKFELYKEGSASLAASVIIDWTSASAIVKGVWNKLSVSKMNNFWTGTINGTQVFQVAAEPVSGATCGFILLPNTVGYADDLLATLKL